MTQLLVSADCVVCSGPLHDTWLGSGATVAAVLYFCAAFWAAMDILLERERGERPRRGCIWIAAARPFAYLGRFGAASARFLAEGLLPPERQPRPGRRELEQRIEDLERELEIEAS
jgi:hypothetical protein